MRGITLLVGLSMLSLTLAEAQPTAPAPTEQALAMKLMAEINAGLQCSGTLVAMQQEQGRLQARIKALEEKYEQKPAIPKPE